MYISVVREDPCISRQAGMAIRSELTRRESVNRCLFTRSANPYRDGTFSRSTTANCREPVRPNSGKRLNGCTYVCTYQVPACLLPCTVAQHHHQHPRPSHLISPRFLGLSGFSSHRSTLDTQSWHRRIRLSALPLQSPPCLGLRRKRASSKTVHHKRYRPRKAKMALVLATMS